MGIVFVLYTFALQQKLIFKYSAPL